MGRYSNDRQGRELWRSPPRNSNNSSTYFNESSEQSAYDTDSGEGINGTEYVDGTDRENVQSNGEAESEESVWSRGFAWSDGITESSE